MNTYNLTVRGETVRLVFKRVNDSRRLKTIYTSKKDPNLFQVRGAMVCTVSLPAAMAPSWWTNNPSVATGDTYDPVGVSYCHWSDKWNSTEGRHRSLKAALDYFEHDPLFNADIVDAFTAEEQRRAKVVGPARLPKTAKPKPPRPRVGRMERLVVELRDLVSRLQAVEEAVEEKVRPAESLETTAQ